MATPTLREAVAALEAAVASKPADRDTMAQPLIDLAQALGYRTDLDVTLCWSTTAPECYLRVTANRPLETRRGTVDLYPDALLRQAHTKLEEEAANTDE